MFSEKVRTAVYVSALMVLAIVVVACTPAGIQPPASSGQPSSGGITVVGRGEALGKPDLADIKVGVETFSATVAETTSQNEADVQRIMAALDAMGIDPADIQTSNYSLWAEQIYGDKGPEGIAGYRVSNQVNVTIRDIDRVGEVIGVVTEAGANNIFGVSFSVFDPAALEAEAREKAIANAREKAISLAGLSDVELGEVVAVSEVTDHAGVPLNGFGGGAVAEAARPGIAPGLLNIQVQVQVTFGIQ